MSRVNLLTKEELAEFKALFPVLVKDITTDPSLEGMFDTNKCLAKVLEYNVPFGKHNRYTLNMVLPFSQTKKLFLRQFEPTHRRGQYVALTYKYLGKDLSKENIQLSYVLAWCVELFQAFFLVADDMIDKSETRRGRPCWHKLADLAALNDSFLMEASIYVLLKKYFRDKDYYLDLLEIFHDATMVTAVAQSLDTRTGLEKKIEAYTMDLFDAISINKTAYYTCYFPVSLAMTMAGVRDDKAKEQARTILFTLGHLIQVEDDYRDCFSSEDETGKTGTDVSEGKCTWLVVTALQRATPAQRKIIMNNYGRNDPDKVEKIKQLFGDLGIHESYRDFSDKKYKEINKFIEEASPVFPKRLFRQMLEKVYGRTC